MKKVHYLPLALLLGAGVAFAAPRRVITGTVVSQKDGRPLELATARLVLRADTTKFLAGAVTDSLGRFRIVTDTTAALRLRVGFVGLRSAGRDVNSPRAVPTASMWARWPWRATTWPCAPLW